MFDPDVSVVLFRGPFLLIVYIGLLSLNLAVWTRARINYIRIFELKPGRRILPRDLIKTSLFLWILWSAFNSISYFHTYFSISDPSVVPLLLLALLILYLFNPLDVALRSCRLWILKTIWRIICAPFYNVKFADFWLGDQLVSLAQVFKDVEFSGCFSFNKLRDGVSTVPDLTGCLSTLSLPLVLAGGLPSWFRAAQCLRRFWDTKDCFPHMANAIKYSFALIDVALVYLVAFYRSHPYWDYIYVTYFCNKMVQTIYSYYWDIVMDWGLVVFKCGIPAWSNRRLMYKHRWIYVLAMVEDLVLRFCWLYVIVVKTYLPTVLPDQTITTSVATLEIFRRIIWNLFRVENEHVNNCGEFRQVADIPELEPQEISYLQVSPSCKMKKKVRYSQDRHDDSDENQPLIKSFRKANRPSFTRDCCSHSYQSMDSTMDSSLRPPCATQSNLIHVV
eukprot:TRINITY_DN5647_c0_g1_i1.p1 TRINITY_DN5647_c0_g1~~TRINITY_DN5647_c0_g1_i1.p1  ORF type:complete len:447 (-),score=55.59 TRINITY_DN5647_c0_g1_i1:631-1971(-)